MKTMNVDPNALVIMDILEKEGAEAYVVGGCTRDSLISEIKGVDKKPKDWDITTSMKPDDVMRLFKEKGYNVVPTGIKHGTVTVYFRGCTQGYEITTYRIDGEYLDGRHPSSVKFTCSLRDDVSRRDFTINSMAYSEKRGLVDYFNGKEDIERGIIRAVGNADDRFKEDALRMMRAVRFSAQLGFTIADDVIAAIKKNAFLIMSVSQERIHDELTKILMSDHPDKIEILFSTGLLKHFLPELHLCFMTRQNNPWHLYNVGKHTMEALRLSDNDLSLRVAVMLHDIGKPACKTTGEDGIDHFKGHPEVSAKKANEALRRLRFPAKVIEDAVKLISVHDIRIEPNKKSIKRFMNRNDINDRLFRLYIKLRIADCKGQNPELAEREIKTINDTLSAYEEIKNEPMSVKDLNINGLEIMDKGYSGPEVGDILRHLLDRVLDDPSLNTNQTLNSLVEEKK